MTNLESLRSLQKRIRDATGPDRFLDADIWRKLVGDVLPPKNYPKLTLDPDGLGACVALMKAVLPGYTRIVDASAPSAGIDVDLSPPCAGTGWIKGTHDRETHALLLAIVSALIAEMETKQLEQASSDHKAVKD